MLSTLSDKRVSLEYDVISSRRKPDVDVGERVGQA